MDSGLEDQLIESGVYDLGPRPLSGRENLTTEELGHTSFF